MFFLPLLPLTVDRVMKRFEKAIRDLDKVGQNNRESEAQSQLMAREASLCADDYRAEADRAFRIAAKLKDLVE